MDATAATAIVALFVPLIVSVAKQAGWSSSVNGFVAIAVYVLFGVGACITSGQQLNLNDITPFVTIFVTVGSAAYFAFWKNTGLETALTTSTSVVNAPGTATPNPPKA